MVDVNIGVPRPGFADFEHQHLEAVLTLCENEGWGTFPADPDRALRALTAPGVITVVALEGDGVIGFAQVITDGEVTAYLALLAVAKDHRRSGIGKALLKECLRRSGALRVDLLADNESDPFYESFSHRSLSGFRLYPLDAGS